MPEVRLTSLLTSRSRDVARIHEVIESGHESLRKAKHFVLGFLLSPGAIQGPVFGHSLDLERQRSGRPLRRLRSAPLPPFRRCYDAD